MSKSNFRPCTVRCDVWRPAVYEGDRQTKIGYFEKIESKALFHEWGTNAFTDEKIQWTVAIVELEDGRIRLIEPEQLQFTDRKEY